MANTTTMTYGGYSFEPVPFITIRKNYIKTGDGISRGTTFSLTLNGTLTALDDTVGFQTLVSKKQALREAFNCDGLLFQIKCDDNLLLEAYPRVLDLQFNQSNNNWVFTIPYTITLEYEQDPVDVDGTGFGEDNPKLHPAFISSFSEDWGVEFSPDQSNPYTLTGVTDDSNPYLARFTHNINAVGKSVYSGTTETGSLIKPAWKQARDYVSTRLGFDEEIFNSEISLNLSGITWAPYDHYRVSNTNESEGSFSVQESWMVLGDRGGISRKAIEDFTIDVTENQQDGLDTVSIQGNIQGLEERSYDNPDFEVTGLKYDNALAYYNSIKTNTIYQRVNDSSIYDGSVNITPLTKTVGHSPNQGIVTYSYTYNNRPSSCIAGAKFEDISVSDSNPTDVFAALQIMGRSQGPILQSFNTVTEFTRTVSINLVMPPSAGCTVENLTTGAPDTEVNSLLCLFETDLNNNYDKVYKSSDTREWQPKVGTYTRSVTWTAVTCDSSPSTSLC